MSLVSGRITGLFLLIVLLVLPFIVRFLERNKKIILNIRRIPALDAIEESIGRATEMNRPVHFTTGLAGITDVRAPMTIAAISILSNVARLCARLNTRLFVTVGNQTALPLTLSTVSEAYRAENAMEYYSDDIVEFPSGGYRQRIIQLLQDEKCAANIMIGAFHGEAMLLVDGGHRAGAINIGGNPRIQMIPFFVVGCDYTLIGEENYAASITVSEDPEQLSYLGGQDFYKIIVVLLIFLGSIFMTAGSEIIINLLKG